MSVLCSYAHLLILLLGRGEGRRKGEEWEKEGGGKKRRKAMKRVRLGRRKEGKEEGKGKGGEEGRREGGGKGQGLTLYSVPCTLAVPSPCRKEEGGERE